MGLVINDSEKVQEQYAKANGLNTRISIHDKYSTNKMGISNWNFTIYQIERGMKVLELGCGTGSMWIEHKDVIEKCSELVLSDFSEGMLASAKANLGGLSNVTYKIIDIMDIPYEDGDFDVVIANYMLYHVPDIDKALSEVNRVLRKGGYFYAGTSGEKGIMETIVDWLGLGKVYVNTFSLENGGDRLKNYFPEVEIQRYHDSLEVTDIDDLMDYIYSGITFNKVCTLTEREVRDILESHMENGIIKLPKDPGMFVCKK